LSPSEKQFVQLIYQVSKKVVSERPVGDGTTVPVLSKEDFKLAFASVLKTAFAGLAMGGPDSGRPAKYQPPRAFRATLYAEDDYPLGSIKAQAVKVGVTGDSYFAACLISMIDMQPRSIMRMINKSHSGTYMITFPGLHGKSIELMPPREEEVMHYGLSEKYGYWYPLLEKAYGMYVAQNYKLASSLEHGKDMSPRVMQAMEALTSAQTGSIIVADWPPEEVRSRIMERLAHGKVVIAISGDAMSQAATLAGAAPLPMKPYAVQGYDQNFARIFVRGIGSVNTSNLDEPVLQLTTEKFVQYFKVAYFEKDLDNARRANVDIHPSKTNNPWRKIPGE
jgi:hypothetical protein